MVRVVAASQAANANTCASASAPISQTPQPSQVAKLQVSGFEFAAADPGAWGNSLRLSITTPTLNADTAATYKTNQANCFSLSIEYTKPDGSKVTEVHPVVTIDDSPSRLDRVLSAESELVVVAWPNPLPSVRPDDIAAAPFTDGLDSSYLTAADLIGNKDTRTGLFAPDIQKLLLNGKCPTSFDGARLFTKDLPLDWNAQRAFLGLNV